MFAQNLPYRTSHHRRRAVTLIEVCLVLAIILLLGAIVWPTLDGPMDRQRLRKAADIVRTEWAKARIRAMTSGDTYLFRYQFSEGIFSVEGREEAEAGGGGGWGTGMTIGGEVYVPMETVTPSDDMVTESKEESLPEGVIFAGDSLSGDTRSEAFTADDRGTPYQLDEGWSEPVLFHPDGTTSDARLILKNKRDTCIELTLRGLTGIVTVSDSFSSESYQGDINIDAAYVSEEY